MFPVRDLNWYFDPGKRTATSKAPELQLGKEIDQPQNITIYSTQTAERERNKQQTCKYE